MANVAGDTHDFHRHGKLGAEIAAQIGDHDAIAERVLVREERASQDVVNHHHVGAAVHIPGFDVAPA